MFKVTVLMPVFNGAKYLQAAIDSVLNQTFKDFEFLIINDGSTDDGVKIIESYHDPRIRLIHNEKNIGLAETCNRGLELATGEYIVRMDCDDISLPDRLKRQIAFIESRPEVGICGTWAKVIGEHQGYIIKKPTDPQEIKISLLFNTCFIHPTVIMRKKVLDDSKLKFKKEFDPGDDYVFWTEISEYTEFANLPEIQLLYRMHPQNISKLKSTNQLKGARQARLNMLHKLKITPSEEELKIHQTNSTHPGTDVLLFLSQREKWLKKIDSQNDSVKYYNSKIFKRFLATVWLESAIANAGSGWSIFSKCLSSPLIKKLTCKNYPKVIKLFIKCLLQKNNINE